MSILEQNLNSIEQSNDQVRISSSVDRLKALKAEKLGLIENSENSENSQAPDQLADAELAIMIGKGESKATTPGQVLSVRVAKSQLNNAQPSSIKQLITTNFGGQSSSGLALSNAKNQRIILGIQRFGKNPQSPQVFSQFSTQTAQTYNNPQNNSQNNNLQPNNNSLAASLTTALTGQNPLHSSDQVAIITDAKKAFIKYMIAIMTHKDKNMGARLFAAYHFNDNTVFDKFHLMEDEMFQAYKRFLGILNQK